MNIAGFYDESISNGLGWRAVLFVSGCPHGCPGCQNKEAQNFKYGKPFNKQEIIDRICENSILKGVTLSGGEPLCKENIPEVLDFVKSLKAVKPEFNIWCYSGYTLEELEARNDKVTNEMLENIDLLVDGEFVEAQKKPNLRFKGSSNQRILDIPQCLRTNEIVELAM